MRNPLSAGDGSPAGKPSRPPPVEDFLSLPARGVRDHMEDPAKITPVILTESSIFTGLSFHSWQSNVKELLFL